MVQEKMTIREALTQKKLLEKQIEELFDYPYFATQTSKFDVVGGMSIAEWEKDCKATYDSLNGKLKRLMAITNAIMLANATHTVEVKKFNAFEPNSKEMEKITFATAIARKKYFFHILEAELSSIESKLHNAQKEHRKLQNKAEETISTRVKEAFSNVTQSSPSNRIDYEVNLRDTMKVEFKDPSGIGKNIRKFKEYVEEYMAMIDSTLGRATEITEIVVEY